MITYSKDRTDQIGMIATCLVDNFAKTLYDFFNEKNYSVYVRSLAEITDWSYEFYNQYYYKLHNWETFEKSKDNIYNALNGHDFLVAWGHSRIRQFYAEHANAGEYSREYSDNVRQEQTKFP